MDQKYRRVKNACTEDRDKGSLSSLFVKELDIRLNSRMRTTGMSTARDILKTIDRFPKGYVFTYGDLVADVRKKEAVFKALNQMAAAGKIAKLSKGKFYKPESTRFGDLQPDKKQIVKDLLGDDGKITGYLTGLSIYNQLGLTTQVSNTLQIGKNQLRPSFKRELQRVASSSAYPPLSSN